MRIVTLTSDDAHHLCLISLLTAKFDVVGAIVEPAIEQRNRLRRLGRWSDYLWRLYHDYLRKFLGLSNYRREFFESKTDFDALKRCQIVTVPWINDSMAKEKLKEWTPQITIVCGTSILKTKLLRLCGETLLNVHGGHLPDYRGNHCFFFALYNRAFDKIGSTIHFVDIGIDTGDIVSIVKPAIYPDDNAEKLYCRADWQAFLQLRELLRQLEHGIPLPRQKQPHSGKTYRTRDRKPWHDIVLGIKRSLGIFKLPYVPEE